MAIIRDNDTPSRILKVNSDGSINTTVTLAEIEVKNDSGNPVPVSGTVAVSGSVEVSNDSGNPLPVNGTVSANQGGSWSVSVGNFPASQAVSDGGGSLTVDGAVNADLRAAGAAVTAANPVPVSATAGANTDANPIYTAEKAATLAVTGTAAAAAGVTVTLPAAGAGLFHYITGLEITLFASAAGTAAAAPVVVTSTNLPGSMAWSFEAVAAAVGARSSLMQPMLAPLRSSTANTATTIVCPATASRIWRVNVQYYTGP